MSIDVRLELRGQEPAVILGQSAAPFLAFGGVVNHAARRRVFMNPFFAGVGHGHDDEGFDQLFPDQLLRRFVDAPLDVINGGRGIEDFVSIVDIENRETAGR